MLTNFAVLLVVGASLGVFLALSTLHPFGLLAPKGRQCGDIGQLAAEFHLTLDEVTALDSGCIPRDEVLRRRGSSRQASSNSAIPEGVVCEPAEWCERWGHWWGSGTCAVTATHQETNYSNCCMLQFHNAFLSGIAECQAIKHLFLHTQLWGIPIGMLPQQEQASFSPGYS